MNRDNRRGDSRRGGDTRDHRARHDRSRSPAHRERRNDQRRDRSPYRGPARGPPHRSDRDRDYLQGGRGRQLSGTPPPPRRPGDKPPPRQSFDTRANGAGGLKPAKQREVVMESLEDEDEEMTMQRIMGFKGFRSTKNTKVPGNDKNHAVYKVKKNEYRQYMNRVGGFNRLLSPTRVPE